ncbi:MAG TPA: DUF4124 domain-containing protein [Burkholderiaceae bacterium]|nr:DUF4124 domain-containing protein [Burkholderiaceae bacterium]
MDLAQARSAGNNPRLFRAYRMCAVPFSAFSSHRLSNRLSRFALAALIGLLSLPVAAQWAWREDNGRVVYSDRPPPPSVKSSQIIRQPGTQSSSAPMPGNTRTAAESKADGKEAGKEAEKEAGKESTGPKTYAEKEMEFRKRQQERAEAAKKQQEEQGRATQKAQECERQRGYLRALEDGVRVSRSDAQGNREVLDDAQRAAETKRIREAIAQSCS